MEPRINTNGHEYDGDGATSSFMFWGGWVQLFRPEGPAQLSAQGSALGNVVDIEIALKGQRSLGCAGTVPPITGRECLRVLMVIYGLYAASEAGRTVSVE